MTKKRTIDPTMIDAVAQNMFYVLPLLKKRLMHMDMVQKEHGTPLSHVQVLAMLQDSGTMSVSEISRRLGIAKPNITP
ncbi:MAG: MarR family transcriptional regulator, partial [Clostridia bacterium]|nr:MarR family transcriptional regulator [Clostridia bacterium]